MDKWERRIKKLLWAKANPEKAREASRRWRAMRPKHVREQTRLRMRRWRAKQ